MHHVNYKPEIGVQKFKNLTSEKKNSDFFVIFFLKFKKWSRGFVNLKIKNALFTWLIEGYGAPPPEHSDPEPAFVGSSFSDKAVRRGFIRKVSGTVEGTWGHMYHRGNMITHLTCTTEGTWWHMYYLGTWWCMYFWGNMVTYVQLREHGDRCTIEGKWWHIYHWGNMVTYTIEGTWWHILREHGDRYIGDMGIDIPMIGNGDAWVIWYLVIT